MKKITALIAIAVFVSAVNAQAASSDDTWENYTGQVLNVEHVSIHAATNFADNFKKGDNTLGGPGPGPGAANFAMDGFTQPSGVSSPTLFTLEQYAFSGGTSVIIDHQTVISNNAGPYPTQVSLAFAWQACGNGSIFPPLPDLLGTTMDGVTLSTTLSTGGIWYVAVGISGLTPGTYDWGWMARYDGLTPIPVPPAPDTDLAGFAGVGDFGLHNTTDDIGDGSGSGRPWCFEITP